MFLSSYNDKITHLLNLSLIVSLLSSLGCKPLTLSFDRKEKIPLSTAPLRQPVEILPANGVITVRKNDNVFVIATRYQVTPQSIIENSLSPPFTLREDQCSKYLTKNSVVRLQILFIRLSALCDKSIPISSIK